MISKFIFERLGQSIIVIILVSIISFLILNAAPGDPALAMFGAEAEKLTEQQRKSINHSFGMDEPAFVRYVKWGSNMLKGDMGISYREGRPVNEILKERIPNTLKLFSVSMMLILIFSIILGIKAGLNEGSKIDKGLSIFSIVLSSIPAFWLGIMFIYIFSVKLNILPSSGTESLRDGGDFLDKLNHIILPASVMALTHVGLYGRFIQEKIKDENKSYYVQVQRANGVDEKFITKGILKNAMVPYINYLGITLPAFFGGSIVIESLFSWWGLGQLSVKATMTRDYPLLMGTIMISGILVVLCIMLTDILSLILNPNLRRLREK